MSFIGSRYRSNRYYVYQPASQEFCSATVPPDFTNVIGNGVCGVNGFSLPARTDGVSSYEKDGSVNVFRATYTGLSNSPNFTMNARLLKVDEQTFYSRQEIPLANQVSSTTQIFLNNFTEISGSVENYYGSRMTYSMTFDWKKATEQEWLAAIEQAYEDNNVLPEDQVQGGQLPMITDCVTPEHCATEEDWCTLDPECSESPYQEPDATIRAGPIVGLVMLGVVLLFALAFWWHLSQLAKTKERNRALFARRIAETIDLSGSDRQMTPEALAAEFKRIDKDREGTISKEDLWEFISSGKAGQMSEKDFNILFSSLDTDRSGNVDFMEFFAFMGQCHDDFQKVKNRKSVREARPSFAAALSERVVSRRGSDFVSNMVQVEEEEKNNDADQA